MHHHRAAAVVAGAFIATVPAATAYAGREPVPTPTITLPTPPGPVPTLTAQPTGAAGTTKTPKPAKPEKTPPATSPAGQEPVRPRTAGSTTTPLPGDGSGQADPAGGQQADPNVPAVPGGDHQRQDPETPDGDTDRPAPVRPPAGDGALRQLGRVMVTGSSWLLAAVITAMLLVWAGRRLADRREMRQQTIISNQPGWAQPLPPTRPPASDSEPVRPAGYAAGYVDGRAGRPPASWEPGYLLGYDDGHRARLDDGEPPLGGPYLRPVP